MESELGSSGCSGGGVEWGRHHSIFVWEAARHRHNRRCRSSPHPSMDVGLQAVRAEQHQGLQQVQRASEFQGGRNAQGVVAAEGSVARVEAAVSATRQDAQSAAVALERRLAQRLDETKDEVQRTVDARHAAALAAVEEVRETDRFVPVPRVPCDVL